MISDDRVAMPHSAHSARSTWFDPAAPSSAAGLAPPALGAQLDSENDGRSVP
jgi:hypothetical protein